MKKSTFLHLRIPFSYYLMPVFLFAMAVDHGGSWIHLVLTFFILHLLIYPASNGYNSYFDKDEESIGGLRNPPKVSKELYWISISMDLFAVVLGLLISPVFSTMIFIYGMISKAYSHPMTRWKKYPLYGWLAAGVFQGYFTFLTCQVGFGANFEQLTAMKLQIPALLSSLLLFGSYPMTQIYQHGEDQRRGDITLSIKLGVLGTFHFTAVFFSVSIGGFILYFLNYQTLMHAVIFLVVLGPVLFFFLQWYFKVRRNADAANFDNTMKLNAISATCFNLFFLGWYFFA